MSYDAENRNNRFVCPLLTRDGLNNYKRFLQCVLNA